MAQRVRIALIVVPPLLAVACAAAPPKATSPLNAYERSILARKAPPWVHQAEQETARYLRSRCFDLAPLADSWEASEDWRTCRARASLADRATWAPILASALSECERTGVACCFRRVSDDERHNAHWQRACEAHRLIPVSHSGASLVVAMVDPTDSAAVEALANATGCPIEPVVAEEGQLRAALDRYYPRT